MVDLGIRPEGALVVMAQTFLAIEESPGCESGSGGLVVGPWRNVCANWPN